MLRNKHVLEIQTLIILNGWYQLNVTFLKYDSLHNMWSDNRVGMLTSMYKDI